MDKDGKKTTKTKIRNVQDGIETQDFAGQYDKEYYWDNLILPNCSRLLKVVFPEIDWDDLTYTVKVKKRTKKQLKLL